MHGLDLELSFEVNIILTGGCQVSNPAYLLGNKPFACFLPKSVQKRQGVGGEDLVEGAGALSF